MPYGLYYNHQGLQASLGIYKSLEASTMYRGFSRTWRVAEKALEHLHWCSVCDLAKIFLTSMFSYLLFTTSRVKVKRGLQIGGRLLVATHLEQSNYLANQQQVLGLAMASTTLCIQCKNAGSKPFCWAIQFSLQGHTLSTHGTDLSHAW